MGEERKHYAKIAELEENGAVDPADVHRPKTDEEVLREENQQLDAKFDECRGQNVQLAEEVSRLTTELKQHKDLAFEVLIENHALRKAVTAYRAQAQT